MKLTLVLRSVTGEIPDEVAAAVITEREDSYQLRRADQAVVFFADLAPGSYEIRVEAEGLIAPQQYVIIGDQDVSVAVYLGPAEWPYYRMGSSLVPYEPNEELVAIVSEDVPSNALQAFESLESMVDRFDLKAVQSVEQDDNISTEGRADAFRLYQLSDRRGRAAVGRLYDEIQTIVGDAARIGMPVDLRQGQRAVIDRFFAVRFRPNVDQHQAEALISQAGAEIERKLVQSPNGFLIRFKVGHPMDHLDRIEAWHRADLLIYGEPDLITEISDDVFPYTDPSDPTYASQANLTLQRVPEAWVQLADIDPKIATGNPRVTVATLDRGIDVDHPDLGATLTDGTDQMSRCFDFSDMRECTVVGYEPDTDHGMGVYGIISAEANNNENIAGIAPNTHHIGMERPSLTSVNYADVLLWAAGFDTGNSTTGWPAEPLRPGADIISCSHGQNNLALSGVMDDTFQTLTRDGRRGLGTIVVYSAGNSNQLITGFRTWAAHPNTIAVANSLQPNGAGVETKSGTSNFGPEIDVCAQGDGAPSLDASGGEQNFNGTSAAAPTVAAICALVLSVEPNLTWRQVRDILRVSAVQIDTANTDPIGQWVDGFSQWYGNGRVDAAAAVMLAKPYRGRLDTDHDGDDSAEIPIVSPWGIGTLEFDGTNMTALAMARNGSRFNGWLLNTRDNDFPAMGDFDGDGAAEILVTSPWGIGVLNVNSGSYSANLLARNGTRFGGWLLNTGDNRFGPVGDFDGDGIPEILVTSPWGIGVFKLSGSTFSVPLLRPNGTLFGSWLLNTADNRFGPVGDFDGDGCDEIIITSPWGVGLLKINGDTFETKVIKRNGTRFGGWLLNTADNTFGPVGDFDGDNTDEVLIFSPWGVGLLKLDGSTFDDVVIKSNGTRFGGWLLNTHDNIFRGAGNFGGRGIDSLFVTSPWGIGVWELDGDTFNTSAMEPNGNRIGGWLLNTEDNHFKLFADLTGNGRANVLLSSPWGIGVMALNGTEFEVPFLAPNGSRFGGWLLNTADNALL